MSLRGFWWKGHWHTVTIPPLLHRITSPELHTSHMDQWHNSCQSPNVTHVPTVLLQTSPSFYTPPLLRPFARLSPSFLSCLVSLSLLASNPLLPPPCIASLTHMPLLVYLLPSCLFVSCLIPTTTTPFCPSESISPPLSLFVALCSCVTYASSGIPFQSCCGSCPFHFVWGWSFWRVLQASFFVSSV